MLDYRELFAEMADTIVTRKLVPDDDIETMSEEELKILALEKTRKGVATKHARMAQEELYERKMY